MKICRLTPERYEAHQRKIAKARGENPIPFGGGDTVPRPSKAFEEAFAKAGAVIAGYMDGTRARSFTLTLPVPQSVNHNTRPDGRGGRLLTPEHRAFRQKVAIAVYQAKIEKLYGILDVRILLNAPRLDVDNVVKPVLDALQRAGAIDNDRNVHHLEVTRNSVIAPGAMSVRVNEI